MVVRRFADRPYVWRTVLPATKAQGKNVVEECLVLSIKELFDKGLLANHSFHMGSWRWADANISQFNGAVSYEADLRDHEKASLRLQYENRWLADRLLVGPKCNRIGHLWSTMVVPMPVGRCPSEKTLSAAAR